MSNPFLTLLKRRSSSVPVSPTNPNSSFLRPRATELPNYDPAADPNNLEAAPYDHTTDPNVLEPNSTAAPSVQQPTQIPEKPPGRFSSFLQGFLQAAGAGANRALEQGQGWEGVAQAVGEGLGGGAVGAANPSIILKQRQAQRRAQEQKEQEAELALAQKRAALAKAQAETVELKGRPAREDAKLKAEQDRQQAELERQRRRDDLNEQSIREGWDWHKYQQAKDAQEREFRREEAEKNRVNSRETAAIRAGNANLSADMKDERERREALSQADANDAAAKQYQKQIDDLVAQDTKEATYNPVINKDTGRPQTGEDGRVVYSNEPTEAYKERHKQIDALATQIRNLNIESGKLRAKGNARTSSTVSETTSPAPKGTFSIKAAISRGMKPEDAKAKAERAKLAGWKVID